MSAHEFRCRACDGDGLLMDDENGNTRVRSVTVQVLNHPRASGRRMKSQM